MSRLQSVIARIAGLFVSVILGMFWLADPFRYFEAGLVVAFCRMLGVDRVLPGGPESFVVQSAHGSPFVAVVSESCSAIAPILVFGGLTVFVLGSVPWLTRLRAFAIASALVFFGNFTRIALSALVGAWQGKAGLILFHDLVGTVFSFALLFTGLVVLVRQMLPNGKSRYGLRYSDRLVLEKS
jgi:exosortase/archaeosortase family protein